MIRIFTKIKSKKVYEYVIEQIQEMILSGKLKKGDKLPPERDLTEQLGVSRTSVREALRALDVIGLIESRQGEGNFITGNISNSIFEPLSVNFILNRGNPKDILELRTLIEVQAAYLAATKINEVDSNYLKDLTDKLETTKEEKLSAELDKKFHYKICEITKNQLIINIMSSLQALIERFIMNTREQILTDNKNKSLLVKHHRQICNAIVNKNPSEASNTMKKHLNLIDEIINTSKTESY